MTEKTYEVRLRNRRQLQPTRAFDKTELRLLAEIRHGAEHTAALAYLTGIPLSTVRRRMERLQDAGIVRGIKHDERKIIHGGRVRVYWSMAENGGVS